MQVDWGQVEIGTRGICWGMEKVLGETTGTGVKHLMGAGVMWKPSHWKLTGTYEGEPSEGSWQWRIQSLNQPSSVTRQGTHTHTF